MKDRVIGWMQEYIVSRPPHIVNRTLSIVHRKS